jgi:hypothetical protein
MWNNLVCLIFGCFIGFFTAVILGAKQRFLESDREHEEIAVDELCDHV